MANQEKAVPSLPANTFANAATDSVVAVINGANTVLIPIAAVQAVNTSLGTPANSSSSNVAVGTLWTDGSYFYVATANNTVKRAALTSF